MRVDILTLFPGSFSAFEHSIVSRSIGKNIASIQIINIRDYAQDTHQSVDDTPYGGGAGMVLRVDILHRALQDVIHSGNQVLPNQKPHIVLLSSSGIRYSQKEAQELATKPWIILVCGHYEGVDERFLKYVDQEISIGDYVLSGGEIPAMVIADSIIRLLPGSIDQASLDEESFNNALLEYPHYTRPAEYEGDSVPAILLSGDHGNIQKWRAEQARKKTQMNRPDLLHS